jgi:hypothetical protein
MAAVRLGLGVAHAHDNADPAARVRGIGDEPLAAVDHVVLALAFDPGADVGGIRARDVGLGHREARADLPLEQRVQPPFALLGRREQVQELHVAGIGRRAVEDLGRPEHAAHDLGERRVLEIAEARARLVVLQAGQEKIPQTFGPRLRLQRFEHRRRPGARRHLAPPVGEARHHVAVHEGRELGPQLLDPGRVREFHGRRSTDPSKTATPPPPTPAGEDRGILARGAGVDCHRCQG